MVLVMVNHTSIPNQIAVTNASLMPSSNSVKMQYSGGRGIITEASVDQYENWTFNSWYMILSTSTSSDATMSSTSTNPVQNKVIKEYVDTEIANIANPSENVTFNANGQLDVGGRLGQMSNSTGVYSPKTINPAAVGNGSFLLPNF